MKSETKPNNKASPDGLTIREYFAALALQGLMAADTKGEWSNDDCAATAVHAADELIKCLNE